MVTDTWESRERPLLEAIAEADARGRTIERASDLEAATVLPRLQVEKGLAALLDAEMISGIDASSHSGFDILEITLREKGRRRIGQWPTDDAYAELLRVLADRIERTQDDEERSRLKRLRDTVADVGKGVVSAAMYDLGRRLAGMP